MNSYLYVEHSASLLYYFLDLQKDNASYQNLFLFIKVPIPCQGATICAEVLDDIVPRKFLI